MQNKTSRGANLEPLAEAIRQARLQKGWSQREFSARAGIPQAQISRFETGGVDPRVSTLIELARTLDLHLQLVPRSAVTAVGATVRDVEQRSEERASEALLVKLQRAAKSAYDSAPEREEIASIQTSLQALEPFATRLRGLRLQEDLQRLLLNLEQFVIHPPAQRPRHASILSQDADWLRSLRNHLVHAPEAERPAYGLDEED